jgi:hypothetical protein
MSEKRKSDRPQQGKGAPNPQDTGIAARDAVTPWPVAFFTPCTPVPTLLPTVDNSLVLCLAGLVALSVGARRQMDDDAVDRSDEWEGASIIVAHRRAGAAAGIGCLVESDETALQ